MRTVFIRLLFLRVDSYPFASRGYAVWINFIRVLFKPARSREMHAWCNACVELLCVFGVPSRWRVLLAGSDNSVEAVSSPGRQDVIHCEPRRFTPRGRRIPSTPA